MKTDTRKALERSIIGAVVLEASFYRLADIILPMHFTAYSREEDYPSLWNCISEVAQQGCLDLLTVRVALDRADKLYLMPALMQCTCEVSCSVHLEGYALLLVEDRVRHSLSEALTRLSGRLESLVHRAALRDVMESLAEDDVLELLQSVPDFLLTLGLDTETLDELLELPRLFAQKILRLRKQARIKGLFQQVRALAPCTQWQGQSPYQQLLTQAESLILSSSLFTKPYAQH